MIRKERYEYTVQQADEIFGLYTVENIIRKGE